MHIVIIGAGVLGCAIARHLRLHTKHNVTVFEALEGPGLLTSQWNSGVLHTGIHLKPNSLKARLAKRGHTLALTFCRDYKIPHNECGMIIVGTWQDAVRLLQQAPEFYRILRHGKDLRVKLQFLLPWKLHALEPHVHGLAGILADDAAIVDQRAFVTKLAEHAVGTGAQFHYGVRAAILRFEKNRWHILTPHGVLSADILINAAGPGAQAIAVLCQRNHQVHYIRGEYAEVINGDAAGFSHLIYPIPRPGEGGLGVHITPTTDGRILLGPNTVAIRSSTDYGENTARVPLSVFVDRVKPLWPNVQKTKLQQGYAGIRCKSATGDFVFDWHENALHILGYESPGFTAALAAAEYVAEFIDSLHP